MRADWVIFETAISILETAVDSSGSYRKYLNECVSRCDSRGDVAGLCLYRLLTTERLNRSRVFPACGYWSLTVLEEGFGIVP